jgi:hypothetical protein
MAVDKIRHELYNLKFVNAAGNQVTLLDSAKVDEFIRHIEEYVTCKFNDRFRNGARKEGEFTKAKRERILQMIKEFALVIPEKLNIKLHPDLVLLIHFVNDMAVAQTAEDVEKAIDAFALPAGSYAIKRSAKTNVSINAYPGILAGKQYSFKGEDIPSALNLGFTAPVGVSLSWGIKRGSLGVFIPIIDIGAVTRLRLDDTKDTEVLPELTFKNILSPGLFVSYGFPKSIISVNAGVQYGPQLKTINSKNGDALSYESFFAGMGLVLDIPLFNLHTRPKK